MEKYFVYVLALGAVILVIRAYFSRKFPEKSKFDCKDCPRAKECKKKVDC